MRGAEVSHLAFALAYPNVRDAIMFGDLLTLDIDRQKSTSSYAWTFSTRQPIKARPIYRENSVHCGL